MNNYDYQFGEARIEWLLNYLNKELVEKGHKTCTRVYGRGLGSEMKYYTKMDPRLKDFNCHLQVRSITSPCKSCNQGRGYWEEIVTWSLK